MYSNYSCDLTSNFNEIDLTSNFGSEDMTGADSTTTSNNLVDQLKTLNQKLADLSDKRTESQNKIAPAQAKVDRFSSRTCKKKSGTFHYWEDSQGVEWCADDSERNYQSAVQNIAKWKGEVASYDVQIDATKKQIADLTSQLESIAKSDPKVQAELAQAKVETAKIDAQISESQSKSKLKNILIFGGVGLVLLIGTLWAISKFRKK